MAKKTTLLLMMVERQPKKEVIYLQLVTADKKKII